MTNANDVSLDVTRVMSASVPVAVSHEDRLAQIMDDYLVSLENAVPIDIDQLVAQHPEFADEIRSITASLDLLHDATKQMRPAAEKTDKQAITGNKRLGDFQIGREIGRGGMGVVYEARQISLERQVALKVLPFAAMWDQKQIARFRNEALAAAQLHHPNIVPVFAVGQERGVHFYAMQFIDGRSLDQVIHSQNVKSSPPQAAVSTKLRHTTLAEVKSTSESPKRQSRESADRCRWVARLGKQAAEALHHAHEYGVVHRDIKPSNLMVDDQAKLWITDFGLARIQNNPSVTMTGDVVGTLRYMSPEQAAGQHALVDTRTDIYGLGATLYELLTLQPAFPGEDRNAVLRDIEDKEPTPIRTINPSIPVDLETIVMQAMSKSRDSRYHTAQDLADDLTRFLDGKPTLARRPTVLDRTSKWMRRHRSMVALAALFLVTLTLGSMIAAWMISGEQRRTKVALAESERNRVRAEQHFAQARRVVDRFGIQLADQLQDTPGTERLRQQLLVETLQYYRDFAEQVEGELDVQDQLAMTHLKSGVVTAKLGANRKALANYQAAQRILEQLLEQDPRNARLKSQLALARNNMALLFATSGDTLAARSEYDLAIAAQQQLAAASPANLAYTSQLAESHLNLGTLLGQTGETQEAIKQLTKGVELLRKTNVAEPENVTHARSLAMAYNNLGYVQRGSDATEAEHSAKQAVDLLERVCRSTTATTDCVADLSLCYCNLAAIQAKSDQSAKAISSYQRAITLRESLVRKSPGVVHYRSELAASLNNLALLHIRSEDTVAAGKAFDDANRLFADLLEDYPKQVAYASGWAALLNNQGLALATLGRHDEAVLAYAQAVEVQKRVWRQLPDSSATREALSRIYYNFGRSLQLAGRWLDAAEQALARRTLWQGNGERLFGVAVELAQLVERQEAGAKAIYAEELLNTLEAALKAGYQPSTALADDERFRYWHDNPRYQKLIISDHDELVLSTTSQGALP